MKTEYIAASIAASALMFLAWGCMELSTTETVKPIKAVTKENTNWGFGKKDSSIIKLVAGASVSDDGKILSISDKVHNSGFINRAHTKEGVLKPDTDYFIKLKAKVEGEQSDKNFLHIIVRDLGTVYPDGDLERINVYPNLQAEEVKLKFRTPKTPTRYVLHFISHGKIKAEIADFSISLGNGEDFYPAMPNAPRYGGDLGKLPTGCPDFDIDAPKPAKDIVVNAADFGLNEQAENCATIINNAIAHCKKVGASKLVLPKGKYKIYQEEGIVFDSFTDFTFDGGGSTLVFRKDKGACNMRIKDCVRTVFCNFNMDWDWDTEPLAGIVKLVDKKVSSEKGKSYFEFKFTEYDKHPLYNKKIDVINLSCYDPILKAVGYEGGRGLGFGALGPNNPRPKTEWTSPNTLRVYDDNTRKIESYETGLFFRMQHYYYGLGGIALVNNKHQTLKNINIYSCKGHALVSDGQQQYFQLDNVNIVAPQGMGPRPITCTADHFHFARSRGFFKMQNCEFSLGADDCINIHDCSGFGIRHDDYTILINSKRDASCHPGDPVELRHSDYSKTNYKSKVKSNIVKDGIRYITFEDKLPAQTTKGFVIFNLRYDSSNILIRNCYFHSNRARGLLILTSNVTIEDCRFYHNEMGALKFETGYTMNIWCEGYGVNNVVVRNCKFDTSNPLGVKNQGKERDIFMGVYLGRDPSTEQTLYPIISNILFENNTFKDTFGLVSFIASSGNVIFKDNRFENPTPRKNPLPYRGAFFVTSSSNTKIVNNTYVKSPNVPNPGVYTDDNVSNIIVAGNKVVEE